MKKYSFKRIFRILCLRIVAHVPMSGYLRTRFAFWGGVNLTDRKHTSIGEGVIFDSMYPENICVGRHVHITMRCVILTHFLDTKRDGIYWKVGKVEIKDNAFIGANTVICNSVTIGRNAVVGAGSVVTKDIPDNEIWGGNPAHFIKKRIL